MTEPNPMEEFETEIAEIIVGRENQATKIESLINLITDNFTPNSKCISKEDVEKVLRWYINNENMLSHEHKDGTYIEYVISEYNKLNQLT